MRRPPLFLRLNNAVARRIARWAGRRMHALPAQGPVVTFTFDDFPRTALETGGRILEEANCAGTYFVSLGLSGSTIETGEMFEGSMLPELLRAGHELGCHTYNHCPAWETPTGDYLASVERNQAGARTIAPKLAFTTHSYPISYPRLPTKRQLGRRFRAIRAGGQTYNHGRVDLNYLQSFFLEQARGDFSQVEQCIAAAVSQGGWLIFSTHDIADRPTRYGCTPRFLADTVRCATQCGARILTFSQALDLFGIPTAAK